MDHVEGRAVLQPEHKILGLNIPSNVKPVVNKPNRPESETEKVFFKCRGIVLGKTIFFVMFEIIKEYVLQEDQFY